MNRDRADRILRWVVGAALAAEAILLIIKWFFPQAYN